jgi:mono/diheme cytochrome c family protein
MAPRTALLLAALGAAALLTATALAAGAGPSVRGNPTAGKALFLRPGVFCSSCHTLKAAKSSGRDGPNLDKAKPSYARIVEVVSKGSSPSRRWPTGMPHYSAQGGPLRAGDLTKAEIQNVAAFVYAATHR